MINGVPRYGASQADANGCSERLRTQAEAGSAGGRARLFYLAQASGDPDVGS